MVKLISDNYPVILNHLERSIHAEQVFCSIVTEMKYMQPFKNQIALKMIHKENYQTSYHRNTADGNLKRLISGPGPSEQQLIRMTVECFIEADEHDQNIEDALKLMTAKSPSEQSWLEAANSWHLKRRNELHQATQILKESISNELWQQGSKMTDSDYY